MARYTDEVVKEAASNLLKAIKDVRSRNNPKGGDVYACVKRISRTGMTRIIDFWVICRSEEDRPWLQRIAYSIAVLNGTKFDDDGVKAEGCGMDKGWHVLNTAIEKAYRVLGYDSRRDQIQPHYI